MLLDPETHADLKRQTGADILIIRETANSYACNREDHRVLAEWAIDHPIHANHVDDIIRKLVGLNYRVAKVEVV